MSLFKGTTEMADVRVGSTQVQSVYKGTELVWEFIPEPGFSFSFPHAVPEWDAFTSQVNMFNSISSSWMRMTTTDAFGYCSRSVDVSPGVEYRWRLSGASAGNGTSTRIMRVGTAPNLGDIAELNILTGNWPNNTHTLAFTPVIPSVFVSLEGTTDGRASSFLDYQCVPNI